jgi:hypothetical protein
VRIATALPVICCCLSASSAQKLDLGVVDTIGGTTYDWQVSGPALRTLVTSPGHGIYAVWMYSSDMSGTTFPDRNMRCNFYDNDSGAWNWIEADFMQSGVNAFDKRAGYGNVDADPTTGNAIVSGHVQGNGGVVPRVARDAAPGAGIFEFADGEPVLGACQWPPISVGQDGTIHIFPITPAYDLLYSHLAPGDSNFSNPVTFYPSPGFPTHNIAASKVSNKVCLVWEISTSTPEDAYLSRSTDGGTTWESPLPLDPPDAFGGDTLASYNVTSLFPFYDKQDRLHVVADVHACINGIIYLAPSEIWHWCPDNSPQWARIHRAGAFNPLDSNPTYACRPSIGEDQGGGLYVAWEQFDSSNIEPGPPRHARADIFYAQDNGDNGTSWQSGVRITEQGTWSCRFPSAIDYFEDDTFRVLYIIDQRAGFFVQGEGPGTLNPVVVHKVPVTPSSVAGREEIAVGFRLMTTVVRGDLVLPESPCPRVRKSLSLLDISGRKVLGLHPGENDVSRLPPGLYFVTVYGSRYTVSARKVMIVR